MENNNTSKCPDCNGEGGFISPILGHKLNCGTCHGSGNPPAPSEASSLSAEKDDSLKIGNALSGVLRHYKVLQRNEDWETHFSITDAMNYWVKDYLKSETAQLQSRIAELERENAAMKESKNEYVHAFNESHKEKRDARRYANKIMELLEKQFKNSIANDCESLDEIEAYWQLYRKEHGLQSPEKTEP